MHDRDTLPRPGALCRVGAALIALLGTILPAPSAAHAAVDMPLPGPITTFTGNSRGFWFTAPSCFEITGLRVPGEAGPGAQNVQVVLFGAEPPNWPASTEDFVSLGLFRGAAAGQTINTSIEITAGAIVGILATAGNVTSYGANNYTSAVRGQSVVLRRLGMQFPLSTVDARSLWTETSSSAGRVFMTYEGGCFTSPTPITTSTYGAAYTHTFSTDITAAAYSASTDTLPDGLTLDSGSGALTGMLTRIGAYAYNVTASNGDESRSNAFSLTVMPAPLWITATDATRVYGSPNPDLTLHIDGLVNGDTPSMITGGVSTSAVISSPVGSYDIVSSSLAAANYDIAFTAGTLTVTRAPLTVTVQGAERFVGQTNPTFTVVYSGFVDGEDAGVLSGTLTFSTTATEASAVGAYAIGANGLSSDNYAITFVDGVLRVDDKLTPEISWPAPAALGYGAPLTAAQLNAASAVSGSFDYEPPVGVYLDAGTNQILRARFTPTDLGTYAAVTASTAITVAPAPLTVTIDSAMRLQGQVNPPFNASIIGFVRGQTATVLSGTLVFSTSALVDSSPGTYPVWAAGLSSANYHIFYNAGELLVVAATATLTSTPTSLTTPMPEVQRVFLPRIQR